VPEGSVFASTGLPGDSASGNLSIWWALAVLGGITLVYTVAGGFLAVLMTDFIQFGVLLSVVIFMVPLSLHATGGFESFVARASEIPGFFSPTSPTYGWIWLVLWMCLHVAMIGGDWPFVQRYISVPTVKDARKSTALIGVLYLLTPLIWYLPAMAYRTLVPGPGMDVDPVAMTRLGEGAYVNMSKTVLMAGMVGMMLAAMLSATLSNVSGTLNVYANVYTYEMWGRRKRHAGATERGRIRAGRIFTLVFGLIIIGIAMLVPLAGGAEKVVVTVITMVLCPLYIPSIWGLFSRRLNGNRLVVAMLLSWLIGFTAKFTVPASVLSPSLIESIAGCVVPVTILGLMELWCKARGITSRGFDAIEEHVDPAAQTEPGPGTKEATRRFSRLAVNCFCITIAAIALLLAVLLLTGDPKTVAVKGIVIGFIVAIALLCAALYLLTHKKRL
jgi:Na+/proline symporter